MPVADNCGLPRAASGLIYLLSPYGLACFPSNAGRIEPGTCPRYGLTGCLREDRCFQIALDLVDGTPVAGFGQWNRDRDGGQAGTPGGFAPHDGVGVIFPA